jgi:hypothetical protein
MRHSEHPSAGSGTDTKPGSVPAEPRWQPERLYAVYFLGVDTAFSHYPSKFVVWAQLGTHDYAVARYECRGMPYNQRENVLRLLHERHRFERIIIDARCTGVALAQGVVARIPSWPASPSASPLARRAPGAGTASPRQTRRRPHRCIPYPRPNRDDVAHLAPV